MERKRGMSVKVVGNPAPSALPKVAARILQLTYQPLSAGNEVGGSIAAPVKASKKDAAGFYFHRAALKMRGLYGEFHNVCGNMKFKSGDFVRKHL